MNGDLITTAREVANTFARCYKSINVKSKNAFPTDYRKSKTLRRRLPFNRRGGHPDNTFLNAPFTMQEMKAQLLQCKDTSPGLDDITISMINHLHEEALPPLLHSLNTLWTSERIPDAWRKEVKLPILKPGKDPLLPESYRPISLTSCICKLFERMVNHRLMWFLEKNNILCPQQSGFRKGKSTMDALSQLTG